MKDDDLLVANQYLRAHSEAFQRTFDRDFVQRMLAAGKAMRNALEAGNKILFAGNGGSAADSQHLATEFVSRLSADRRPLPAISITTDSSLLTAAANDYGYDKIFERQIITLAQPGDVFVAISTSGRSKNVLNALAAAGSRSLVTIAFTGPNGVKNTNVDFELRVQAETTAAIQEMHITIGHILCAISERSFLECPL